MAKDPIRMYKKIKEGPMRYSEEIHCPLILKIMLNQGRPSTFCSEVLICEHTFYQWIKKHELFGKCYSIGKMFARENWELEGYQLRDKTNPPGVIDHRFEHWKMIGWSRFGISKNSRIKLELDPKGNPSEHYTQLLIQAANGDFTASEIKQLMEAVNVGLNLEKIFELQRQIDELKSDLGIANLNKNGNNPITNKCYT